MTERERSSAQRQRSEGTSRHPAARSFEQHDPKHQADGTAALRTLAQSMGNHGLTNVLTASDQGSPLEPDFREQMERSLGVSLKDVRVHEDSSARAGAASIDADAFTSGEEIVLGANAPSASEPAGRELLAHELIHVVQQRQAGSIRPGISTPGDAGEREADSASKQALANHSVNVGGGGPAASVQRQAAGGAKQAQSRTASPEEVKQAVLAFFQRAQAAQGGTLHMTEPVKGALRMLANASTAVGSEGDPGRAQRAMAIESVINSRSGDPEELAGRVAGILPDPFDRAALEKLKRWPVTDVPGGTAERVTDLAKKELSKPPQSPNDTTADRSKQLEDEADKMRAARGLPKPHGVGPVSIDILGLSRFFGKLPGTIKPKRPAQQAQAQSYPEVDQAISKIPEDALIPAAARGTDQAGNFADARDLAADLARRLDVAQQKQQDTVDLRLPDSYNQAKDRAAMIIAVVNIVEALRQALPHHASAVKYVDIYFGERLVRRSLSLQ